MPAAFDTAKNQLSSAPLLVHYCDQWELLLACDASLYSVGAVLSHCIDDGSEQPIAYSLALTPVEKKNTQLDREALAIVFGVTKFRKYLVGYHFMLLTDHKPIIHPFGEHHLILQMTSLSY